MYIEFCLGELWHSIYEYQTPYKILLGSCDDQFSKQSCRFLNGLQNYLRMLIMLKAKGNLQ